MKSVLLVILAVPPSLIGLAAVVAVIRAREEDLPEIVRAMFGKKPRDGRSNDDNSGVPPSQPKL
jgi:hypothetical protein